MIRVALCSPDLKIQPLPAPALGTNTERLLRDFKMNLATKAKGDCKGTAAARCLNILPAYLHRLIRLPEEPEAADVA
jgi:hypothetical protein